MVLTMQFLIECMTAKELSRMICRIKDEIKRYGNTQGVCRDPFDGTKIGEWRLVEDSKLASMLLEDPDTKNKEARK